MNKRKSVNVVQHSSLMEHSNEEDTVLQQEQSPEFKTKSEEKSIEES